jgi:hypothetical protein
MFRVRRCCEWGEYLGSKAAERKSAVVGAYSENPRVDGSSTLTP